MDRFRIHRIAAKKRWLKETKRVRYINDNINDALECKWQMIIPDRNKHISIFCSIGEWGSNITDVLCDLSIDHLDFENKNHRNSIFRYYTRLLLIVSEILTDFQEFIIYFKSFKDKDKKLNQNKARILMIDRRLPFTTQQLFDYINHICKHKFADAKKYSKYHLCNHHIDYDFKDSKSFRHDTKNICITDLTFKETEKLEILSLVEIINQVLFCYDKLDEILNDRTLNIQTKLTPFAKTITT